MTKKDDKITINNVSKKDDKITINNVSKKDDKITINNVLSNVHDGLLLIGSVTGRTKRYVGDKSTELVTYKIFAGNKIYFVKDWSPKEYLSVGESVELPIYVKPFQKDGHIMLDYTISSFSVSAVEF
jgi:uncharacterized protein YpmS